MSKEAAQNPSADIAVWFDGKSINEVIFCEEFLRDYPMITVNGTFFTVNGIVNDENRLKKEIYDRIKPYVTSNIAKRVTNLLDVMRMECCADDLLLYQDRIHVANGTYHLDGTFSTEKDYCRNRLPVAYAPDAPQPVIWLHFLSQLFGAGGHFDLAGIYRLLLHSLNQRAEDAHAHWKGRRRQEPDRRCSSCAVGNQHENRKRGKGGDQQLRPC